MGSVKIREVIMSSNSQTYEKVVKVSTTGKERFKRIGVVIVYSLFFAVWVFAALKNPQLLVPIIVAGILCTVMLILISWKYFNVEYEYALWYGSFEVAKIYSKKKRKTLMSADTKELMLVAPATEEYLTRAEHFELDKKIFAISSPYAEELWLLVSGGKDEPRILVVFEADERILDMLRRANPSVFVKKQIQNYNQ